MAATNKCLAQRNKSRTGSKATKKQEVYSVAQFRGLANLALSGQRYRLVHDRWSPWRERPRSGQAGRVLRLMVGVIMHVKFEVTYANGKVHSYKPCLFTLSRDPFRGAPAEQPLAQVKGIRWNI
jgi:hypothetical protein